MKITEDFDEINTIPRKKSKRITKKQIADNWYNENKDNIDWSNGNNRQRFRETSYWLNFVKRIKKSYCEITSLKGKLTLHHLDEIHYDLLIPERFKTIGWSMHKIVHQIDRKKDKSKVSTFWLEFCPSNYNWEDN